MGREFGCSIPRPIHIFQLDVHEPDFLHSGKEHAPILKLFFGQGVKVEVFVENSVGVEEGVGVEEDGRFK